MATFFQALALIAKRVPIWPLLVFLSLHSHSAAYYGSTSLIIKPRSAFTSFGDDDEPKHQHTSTSRTTSPQSTSSAHNTSCQPTSTKSRFSHRLSTPSNFSLKTQLAESNYRISALDQRFAIEAWGNYVIKQKIAVMDRRVRILEWMLGKAENEERSKPSYLFWK